MPVYMLNPLKMLYFQGVSPVLCSSLMYFPLFLPLRAETRDTLYLNVKLRFRRVIRSRAFTRGQALQSEIHPLHKAALRARSISFLCMAYCPKRRASETGSGSCRSKADSRSHARNPLTETADRQGKTATMGLPIHGGIHISGLNFLRSDNPVIHIPTLLHS